MMKRFKAWQTYRLFLLLLTGFFIAGCGDGGNTGHWLPSNPGSTADVTRPRVTAVVPLDNAANVAINTRITATFSEAMNPATINDNTFRVTRISDNTAVSGTVTPSGANAVFRPLSNLVDNTTYTGHDYNRGQGPGRQCAGGKLPMELYNRCGRCGPG